MYYSCRNCGETKNTKKRGMIMVEKKETHVVVVDDDKMLLDVLGKALKVIAEYRVEMFENPLKALEFFENNPETDLLITDYRMPSLNGEQLARNVKAINSKIPIILHTGHPDSHFDQSLFAEMIAKPASLKEIINKAENCIIGQKEI